MTLKQKERLRKDEYENIEMLCNTSLCAHAQGHLGQTIFKGNCKVLKNVHIRKHIPIKV